MDFKICPKCNKGVLKELDGELSIYDYELELYTRYKTIEPKCNKCKYVDTRVVTNIVIDRYKSRKNINNI